MKKVAVFVEGQGEQIFVRDLLFYLFDPTKFSFECLRLCDKQLEDVPYSYGSEDAEVYFQIVNVQGDTGVLQTIRRREKGLLAAGYSKIIGLRDMYSKAYRELSAGKIDEAVIQQFIEGANKSVVVMSQPEKIHLHFAIMELEAWWLCMYTLLEKIDSQLTVEFIAQQLGYDLSTLDAETAFFHPVATLNEILSLVGGRYEKHFAEVESIMSKMTFDDICEVLMAENPPRCNSFKRFCEDLMSY
jgi:hypothetical protein